MEHTCNSALRGRGWEKRRREGERKERRKEGWRDGGIEGNLLLAYVDRPEGEPSV